MGSTNASFVHAARLPVPAIGGILKAIWAPLCLCKLTDGLSIPEINSHKKGFNIQQKTSDYKNARTLECAQLLAPRASTPKAQFKNFLKWSKVWKRLKLWTKLCDYKISSRILNSSIHSFFNFILNRLFFENN